MIAVGVKRIKFVNPKQVVFVELIKGKTSVYAHGDNDGDIVTIDKLDVREPWTVVINTTIGKHYINHASYDKALSCMASICAIIDEQISETDHYLEKIRSAYGNQKD